MAIPERLRMTRDFQDGAAPSASVNLTSVRRSYVLRGAALGLLTAVFARIWMRTLTEDEPVFTVFGTTLIAIVFSGLGAAAGLALAWRRLRSQRRLRTQRGVALLPFLLMGPFIPLFGPSVISATVLSHRHWKAWVRRTMWTIAALIGGFFILVSISRGPVGLASALLYLPLSYVMFVTNRIALEPRAYLRPRQGEQSPPPPAPAYRDAFEPWLA